jgi:chlorobactene glucosyltransferase
MTVLLVVAAVAYGGILFVWVLRHVRLSRAHSGALRPIDPPAERTDWPTVTVLVPAHNEERNLRDCVESILAGDYPGLRVLIVDDRSTDGTRRAADALAAADPRVAVHSITDLDAGRSGKANALRVGARRVDGEWLLFIDADTRIAPDAIASAVHTATTRGADMLSLWPHLENRSFFERLLNPICAGLLNIWCRYEKVCDPLSRAAFAAGQFILIRRAVYESVGGHPPSAWMDDMALARNVKAAGHRLWMGVGGRRTRVRMYDGLRQIVRGWSRIFVGSLEPPWKLPVSLVGTLTGSLMPMVLVVWLGLGVWLGWGTGGAAWPLLFFAMAAAHLAMVLAANWRLAKLVGTARWTLWFYPLAVAGLIWILANSIRIRFFGGAIRWRGRRYRPHEAQERPAAGG